MTDDVPYAPDPRSGIALIERVVIIEQQQKSLTSDTTAIRKSLHDINGELQKLVMQNYVTKGQKGAVALMGTLLIGAVAIGGAIVAVLQWVVGHWR